MSLPDRLLATSAWRWKAGMKSASNHRLIEREASPEGNHRWRSEGNHGHLPSLSDPATIGQILAIVLADTPMSVPQRNSLGAAAAKAILGVAGGMTTLVVYMEGMD